MFFVQIQQFISECRSFAFPACAEVDALNAGFCGHFSADWIGRHAGEPQGRRQGEPGNAVHHQVAAHLFLGAVFDFGTASPGQRQGDRVQNPPNAPYCWEMPER